MTRFQKALPWLIGLVLATILMGSLAVFGDMQYTGNDDAPLLHSTMGYEGGEPATYHLHTHMAFTWLLYGLAKAAPGIAWFSLLQLFLLWISQVVIVKSLCQMAMRAGLPVAAGAITGALFLAAFGLYITDRITYTVTASLCGAAACAQLMSVDFAANRRQVIAGILGSAAMLLACFYLRMSALAPSACFFGLVFAGKALQNHTNPVWLGLLLTLALFAGSAAAQLIDMDAQDVQADTAWHDARITLFDYTGFEAEVPDETLETLHWSRDELALVKNWFFLNDNITAEAFQALTAQQTAARPPASFGSRMQAAWQAVTGLLQDAKWQLAVWCLLLIALAGALRGRRYTWLLLGLALLGGFALLFLLGWRGRLNLRAAYAVLLPMSAVCFTALFFETHGPKVHLPVLLSGIALTAGLIVSVFAGIAQIQSAYIPPNPYFTDTTSDLHADLDEIALMNDDKLIIYDLSLSHDHRLFPDTSEGIPDNVMLWGGWQSHSPSWRKMLEKFAVTDLDASLFLRDTVLFASTYDHPPDELMHYISQSTDGTVDWMYYDQWGYVNLFEFDQY